jgi:hypothetical protein
MSSRSRSARNSLLFHKQYFCLRISWKSFTLRQRTTSSFHVTEEVVDAHEGETMGVKAIIFGATGGVMAPMEA